MQKETPINKLAQKQIGSLNIQEKLQVLTRLNQVWHTHVDIDLVKHTKVANFRDKKLIVAVDNAVWVTRLRYSIPDLFKKLRKEKEFAELERIEWYVEVTEAVEVNLQRRTMHLNNSNAQLIKETAEGISHEKLKQALEKLAAK